MNSLFRRTFTAFVLTLAVVLLVLGGALITGYNRSMSMWSESRLEMVIGAARLILEADRSGETVDEAEVAASIPQDVPVFVYDERGRLVATNRGVGRRRELDQVRRFAVDRNGTTIGTVSVGSTAFRDDAANRALAESLVNATAAGALAAVAVAGAVAWAFARSLSGPAARVAEGIDRIAHGSPSEPIPEEGAEEVVRIAHAANTLSRRLEEEQQLRTQWARDVTHDLRTPIASIRSQLEAIVDGVYSGGPETIGGTLAELGRVEALIDDLDELMRLEAPSVDLDPNLCATESFVSTLRQRFGRELERRHLCLDVVRSSQWLYCDEKLLDRALSNLLANAVRHTPEGGHIELRIEEESPGRTRIVVRNEGDVIPPEELAHVFDRLYRGEYARNTPGSGLGLTIARRIAELHGGDITIESDAQRGTTVTIAIPDLTYSS